MDRAGILASMRASHGKKPTSWIGQASQAAKKRMHIVQSVRPMVIYTVDCIVDSTNCKLGFEVIMILENLETLRPFRYLIRAMKRHDLKCVEFFYNLEFVYIF